MQRRILAFVVGLAAFSLQGTIPTVSADVTIYFQFYSESATVCRSIAPPLSYQVCASGNSSLASSDECAGDPQDNYVCLQVDGAALGNSTMTDGVLLAGLEHMTSFTCDWNLSVSGASCGDSFSDGSAPVHKHWHTQDGTWYCHHGTSTVTTSLPKKVVVSAHYKSCWRGGTSLADWPEVTSNDGASSGNGGIKVQAMVLVA